MGHIRIENEETKIKIKIKITATVNSYSSRCVVICTCADSVYGVSLNSHRRPTPSIIDHRSSIVPLLTVVALSTTAVIRLQSSDGNVRPMPAPSTGKCSPRRGARRCIFAPYAWSKPSAVDMETHPQDYLPLRLSAFPPVVRAAAYALESNLTP